MPKSDQRARFRDKCLGRRRLRSDAIVTEELVLVKHALQDAAQAVFASESEKTTVSLSADCQRQAPSVDNISGNTPLGRNAARTGHVGNVALPDAPAILDEPLHALHEAGELLERRRLESEGRVELNETDQAADRQLLQGLGTPRDLREEER